MERALSISYPATKKDLIVHTQNGDLGVLDRWWACGFWMPVSEISSDLVLKHLKISHWKVKFQGTKLNSFPMSECVSSAFGDVCLQVMSSFSFGCQCRARVQINYAFILVRSLNGFESYFGSTFQYFGEWGLWSLINLKNQAE